MKHVTPRGLVGRIRNEANPAEILAELKGTVSSFQTEQKTKFAALEKVVADFRQANDEALAKKADGVLSEKVDRINAAIDEMKKPVADAQTQIEAIGKEIDKISDKMAAALVNGGGGKTDPRMANPEAGNYCKAFNSYFRKGEDVVGGARALRELEVKAAMSVQSDPDGGYTVTPEMETAIDAVVKQISPMRSLATVRQIGTMEYKKLVNQHGVASGWVGETATRPQTAGANLSELKFGVMEVYAMPAATQTLLDDSFTDIGAWLAGEVQLEFAQKEGAAFINGDGINKPSGLLGAYPTVADASYAWGKLGFYTTGTSGAFGASNPADCLVDTYHGINSAYRQGASWLANRKTLGAIRKLKDGQGNYLLNMVLRPEAFVEEILGRPAIEMPDMPDIAANSLSVAFGDWKRAYIIIDRVGIRVLRDQYTAKPFVLFYTTKRVGGGIQNFEAVKLLKFA